ncbi:hypothetical protein IJT17_09035 [bacterium]|nr:hypothetical protein [bacterium]
MNTIGNLNNLGNVHGPHICTSHIQSAHSETNCTLPEQQDMVSLGSSSDASSVPFTNSNACSAPSAIPDSKNNSVASAQAEQPKESQGRVDAGNGLKATMNSNGVLTIDDSTAFVSGTSQLDSVQDINDSQQNLPFSFTINTIESFIASGRLISINE